MDTNNESKPPTGFYATIREWVEEHFDRNDSHDSHDYYKEFYTDEVIGLPKPKGLDPPPWNLDCEFTKPFVAIIPNGRVWGGKEMSPNVWRGDIITPNNKLIQNVGFTAWWDFYSNEEMPPVTYTSETVAAVAYPWIHNYYHWFLDILPRFHLLHMSGIPIDKYVIGKLDIPYQFESLAHLGIPLDKVIQIDHARFHLKAKNLVVPSLPWNSGPCPKWTCDFVRNNFKTMKNVKKVDGFERIYISREDSTYRNVRNEDKVMEVLAKKGFKKVVLRSLAFHDKVSLFSSAKAIVSPVDAGLTNLAFCSPRTKVIEFSAHTMTKLCDVYWKISHYVNLDYYHMECETEHPSRAEPQYDSIIVDIKKLSRILEMAGL